jgi:hypothetical protein
VGQEETHALQQIFGRLCGSYNAHINPTAERLEIDRFGKQRLGAVLQRLVLRFVHRRGQ